MFWTSIARSVTPPPNLGKALQKLLPSRLPSSLVARPGNLYEVLSRTPSAGVGKHVYQLRWSQKNIPDCYWVVTRSHFKCEGKHGKAWGKLVWKGRPVSAREERIRGSLKYTWAEGQSQATQPPLRTVCDRVVLIFDGSLLLFRHHSRDSWSSSALQ
ncbi:hypothetical protein F5890DRAFT_1399289 [Lentinula detonsa]|uniref:Uncharacterized protein n=1 Tax=Lentinula detonsa TaxID=2804962 RepID=A0AA38Q9V2_9AGAR|nr:hypothetical protein F5890DRAFT_1399289 [Lentinula detonsa]